MNGFALNNAQEIYIGSTLVQEIYIGATRIWPNNIYRYGIYDRVNLPTEFEGGLISKVPYTVDTNDNITSTGGPIINCLDIDLCSAALGNIKIDKISELLVYIKELEDRVKLLEYDKEYLTFEALENTTFTFSQNALQYSIDDGTTWVTLPANTATPTLQAGDKILWKQTGLTPTLNEGIGTFSATGNFNAMGNMLSLFYGDNFSQYTDISGNDNIFRYLFYNCSKLVNAKYLRIGVTILATRCYDHMFMNCTSLVEGPDLSHATTLADECYVDMFRGCSALTKASELPVTTLTYACYARMFYGCTSLTRAPELPALTVSNTGYGDMFYNCTNLNYIKCLATSISAQWAVSDWVRGVQTTSGTFIKNASMSNWPRGWSGIPQNWTVENA